MKNIFECVICRSVVNSPVVSHCCQRIIGCWAFVATWCETSTRCPLCSVSGRMADTIELKGIDDLTSVFHIGEGERESTTVAIDARESTDDKSDDFEEMPSFTTPR